jgi:hypothetical protein
MALNKVLSVKSDDELLSFIINSTPELASVIDLPTQKEANAKARIGKLVMSNNRYKNAFLNALNLIGLTVIQRNYFENPWKSFTERGELMYGQSVREIAVDIANVYDYNEYCDNATHFLENVVPNVYNYVHELNFQKFYKTTTSDEQIAMAFTNQNGIQDLIEEIIRSLYKAYEYDMYIVNKYQLCRRIVDGTITSVLIPNFATMEIRERVAYIKNISNLMTFMSPNYNPAGLRLSTAFENQIAILNTEFNSQLETNVIATSFFRDSAEMKSRSALVDGFGNHDTARLTELLGSAYIPFTADEIADLKKVPAVIIDEEFFQNYTYAMDTMGDPGERTTSFFNGESLRTNHWLHSWKVISTSPFKQAVVLMTGEPVGVTSVTVSPAESSISAGLDLQLSATVVTTGFANKGVQYSIDEAGGQVTPVTVNPLTGLVHIPADYNTAGEDPVVVRATSIYDPTKYNTATITVL